MKVVGNVEREVRRLGEGNGYSVGFLLKQGTKGTDVDREALMIMDVDDGVEVQSGDSEGSGNEEEWIGLD